MADYQDTAPQLTTFASVAAYTDSQFTIGGEGDPERVRGVWGTGALLQTLGVPPALGRTFVAADDTAGSDSQVVLSHDLWQRRYQGATDVPGCSQQKTRICAGFVDDSGHQRMTIWRPGSESNRRTRLCRPLHDHSATWPVTCRMSLPAGTELSCVPEKTKTSADRGSWCMAQGFPKEVVRPVSRELYGS